MSQLIDEAGGPGIKYSSVTATIVVLSLSCSAEAQMASVIDPDNRSQINCCIDPIDSGDDSKGRRFSPIERNILTHQFPQDRDNSTRREDLFQCCPDAGPAKDRG